MPELRTSPQCSLLRSVSAFRRKRLHESGDETSDGNDTSASSVEVVGSTMKCRNGQQWANVELGVARLVRNVDDSVLD